MHYLGQCDEGLSNIIIVGLYDDGEVTVNCSPTTLSNLSFMMNVAQKRLIDSEL